MPGPTIFVIDDQESVRHALGEMLSVFGFTVETYDSAEDKLYSMNCITCHTNINEDHVYQAVADPKSVVKPKTPVTAYSYAWCAKCHDPLNSSAFKDHWPQYVNAIYHGGDKSAAAAAAKELGIDMAQPPPKHE